MREIKFRTWNGEIYSKPFSFYGIITDPSGAGGFIDSDGVSIWWSGMEKSGACVEQYTGLKDKNGMEIYENDILGGCRSDGQPLMNEVVTYVAGMGCQCEPSGDWLGESDYPVYEVIGNIHENPELLKWPQAGW
jgi:hypothetical protein